MTIYNLGSINIDHVYRLEALPCPGETVAARALSTGLGGKGANQSIAAARAGAPVVHLGAIGAADGWVIARLESAGVATGAVLRLAHEASGHAVILVDARGENEIVIHPGANAALPDELVTRGLAPIGPADTLLLQNETALQREAARHARAAGARVIYSAAPFGIEALRAVLPHVSILALNAGEAEAMFRALGRDLPIEGLLITRGAEGAEYHDLLRGDCLHQPAFAVDPVDTTGAGDCLAGWFAAGLDRGEDIATALRHAAAAAALQVTRPGAGDAMPDRAEVMAFLAARG